ncbi:MAG: hypothetical protein AAGA87_15610 [Pseudomonadota bacterium]
MKHALILLAAGTALLLSISLAFGFDQAYALAYGAVAAMALSIAATFFWLWYARATPLALGMGFSWAGATGVMGWWWVHRLLDSPAWMEQNVLLFVFVATYFVGTLLHFQVIRRSIGWASLVLLLPVAAALALSIG